MLLRRGGFLSCSEAVRCMLKPFTHSLADRRYRGLRGCRDTVYSAATLGPADVLVGRKAYVYFLRAEPIVYQAPCVFFLPCNPSAPLSVLVTRCSESGSNRQSFPPRTRGSSTYSLLIDEMLHSILLK